MKKYFNLLTQNGFEIYSVSLSIEELIESTTVAYYNPITGDGYQRALSPAHYRKIAKYLQDNSNAILPTSILTAVDPDQIEVKEQLYISGKLRVVDGQHRIEGIKYLRDHNILAYEKIRNYKFSTLIMVISPEKQVYEIESFININKTSKPVSTDLAVNLRDKIRGNDIKKLLEDVNPSIATKICENLNSNINSIWFESIKLGNDSLKGKTISINAFHMSLIGVVDNYIKNDNEIKDSDDYNKVVNFLTIFIEDAWKFVESKWSQCFNSKDDFKKEKYNIKKGIGVFPINEILSKSLKSSNGNLELALDDFSKIINNSKVICDNWIIGGDFSGFNSKSGFKTIEEYITNKKAFNEEIRTE